MNKWINMLMRLYRQYQSMQRERERGTGRPKKRSTPPTRQLAHGVQIEYSPNLDGDPDPGEVVWTWVPYEDDPNKGKDRPVVIIGRIGNDLAGIQLTSKNKQRSEMVPVGTGAWDPRSRPSYAKADRLLTVDPDEVRREGAVLERDRFDDVIAKVDDYHDVQR